MKYIHIKNLEKYHPGYHDRHLIWAKIYFSIVQGDPDWELIKNEIDKWRFIALVCLELQAKQAIPFKKSYLEKKGFDLQKRPMYMTLKMLHKFVQVRNNPVTQNRIEYNRIEKNRIEGKGLNLSPFKGTSPKGVPGGVKEILEDKGFLPK